VKKVVIVLSCVLSVTGARSCPRRLPGAPRTTSGGAERTIVCESRNYRYRYCRIDTRTGQARAADFVVLRVRPGKHLGLRRRGVWVDRGCQAEFRVGRGGGGNTEPSSAPSPWARSSRRHRREQVAHDDPVESWPSALPRYDDQDGYRCGSDRDARRIRHRRRRRRSFSGRWTRTPAARQYRFT